jgi:asparagine N-glycosylation enzyme membrane subunit Stt3
VRLLSLTGDGVVSNSTKAIVSAGTLCGIMDITAALVVYGIMGAKPLRLLQGIAGGILGPGTYRGGVATALLGLALHFVIAFGAATVFYLASRGFRFLIDQAVLSGVFYGIAVYFFMQRIVIPLSRANRNPFSLKFMIIGIAIHISCVGLPIALSIRKDSR